MHPGTWRHCQHSSGSFLCQYRMHWGKYFFSWWHVPSTLIGHPHTTRWNFPLIGMTNCVHLHASFIQYVNGKSLQVAACNSQTANPSGYTACLTFAVVPEDTHAHTHRRPLVSGSRAVGSPVVCQCVQWPQRLVLVSLQRDQRDMSFIAAGTLFSPLRSDSSSNLKGHI